MAHVAQPAVTIVQEIHHPIFDLYKRSDNIVVRVSHDDAWYTMQEVRDFVTAMHEITNGTPLPFLVIPGKRSSIDKEARSYMATDDAMKDIKAMAIVTESIPHRVIANLFLIVDKPKKPVKLFETTQSAVEWLQNQDL